APTALHPPSLHDALPISSEMEITVFSRSGSRTSPRWRTWVIAARTCSPTRSMRCDGAEDVALVMVVTFKKMRAPKRSGARTILRSEEHTSELQSRENLVC